MKGSIVAELSQGDLVHRQIMGKDWKICSLTTEAKAFNP